MQEVLKKGIRLFGLTVIINFMCFFLAISFWVLVNAVYSEQVGYIAYGTPSGSTETEVLYEHYYADGEDTQKAEFEQKGYTIQESPIPNLSKSANTGYLILTQIFTSALTVLMIGSSVWKLGFKDSNHVKCGNMLEDKLKGLKVGAVACAPWVLILIFLTVTKNGISQNVPLSLYKIVNSSWYSFVQVISGNSTTFGQLSYVRILWLFALYVFIPIIAGIGYFIGYKNYSVKDKLIYKK